MTGIIWGVLAYELIGNIQSEFARRALTSPRYALSTLERRLWKDNSLLSLFAIAFTFTVRLNGIIYLIFLGYQTIWWYAVALWVGGLAMTAVGVSMFRGPTGLALPSIAGFVLLPGVSIYLWVQTLAL